MKSVNAVIKNYSLRFDDYGSLLLSLTLDLQNGGCVCVLDDFKIGSQIPSHNIYNEGTFGSRRGNICGWFLSKVMEVANTTDSNKLVGRPVRAIMENNGGFGDACLGIQHFLDDKIFFIPKLLYDYDDDLDISGIFTYSDDKKLVEKVSDELKITQKLTYKK